MKKNTGIIRKIMSAVGIILIACFALLLAFNVTIIVKGLINSDVPPSVFGYTPLIVKSGSMSSDLQHTVYASELIDMTEEQIGNIKVGDTVYSMYGDYKVTNVVMSVNTPEDGELFCIVERPAPDHIEVGDLIITKTADVNSIKVGDIISFMENSSVVTHRVIGTGTENGVLTFTTKGDANNTEDMDGVPADKVVGVYKTRIPALGDFIYFLQKPLGMALFIGVPVLTFILYDIIRRSRSSKKETVDTTAMAKELAELRKQLEAKNAAEPAETTETADAADKE